MDAILGLPARLDALAMLTRAGRALNDASSKQGAAQGSKLLLAMARGAETSRDINRMINVCDHAVWCGVGRDMRKCRSAAPGCCIYSLRFDFRRTVSDNLAEGVKPYIGLVARQTGLPLGLPLVIPHHAAPISLKNASKGLVIISNELRRYLQAR